MHSTKKVLRHLHRLRAGTFVSCSEICSSNANHKAGCHT